MKKAETGLWGIVLIVIGIIWGLNATGLVRFNIFFPGWWTLFIIIPSFISLLTNERKWGSIVGLLIGICLLLGCWDIVGFDLVWKLFLPVVLVLIGLSMIFKNSKRGETAQKIQDLGLDIDNFEEYWATFSEQKLNFEDKEFSGCKIDSVFGGVEIDLRGAKIKKDAVLRVSAVFGGVTILVDDDVNVEILSTSIFGGVNNKHRNKKVDDEKVKTVYVDASCIFGGVDVK